MDVQEPLTPETLDAIADFAALASPPPVSVIVLPDDWDPGAWCADALAKTVGERCYGVALGTPEMVEDQEAVMTAVTGNGRSSLANANFYMLCHTAVPLLIAEIRRLWEQTRLHNF
jgi:hypothetical protein